MGGRPGGALCKGPSNIEKDDESANGGGTGPAWWGPPGVGHCGGPGAQRVVAAPWPAALLPASAPGGGGATLAGARNSELWQALHREEASGPLKPWPATGPLKPGQQLSYGSFTEGRRSLASARRRDSLEVSRRPGMCVKTLAEQPWLGQAEAQACPGRITGQRTLSRGEER